MRNALVTARKVEPGIILDVAETRVESGRLQPTPTAPSKTRAFFSASICCNTQPAIGGGAIKRSPLGDANTSSHKNNFSIIDILDRAGRWFQRMC